MKRILGIDVAPSHSGWCLMEGGKVVSVGYMTEHKRLKQPPKAAVEAFDHVTLHSYPITPGAPGETPDERILRRIFDQECSFQHVIDRTRPDLAVIEDFAFGAALSTAGSYDAGGISYMVRVLLYSLGIPIRLVDPLSLKLLATNSAKAEKLDMMEAAVEQRLLPASVADLVYVSGNGNVVCATPAEDIADAAWLAQMGHLECQVRAGMVRLDQLNEGARRVFLRTTKRQPTNLLDRPYLPGRRDAA